MRKPIDWDILFMNMAFQIAQRSKDDSTQCGAIIVDRHNVILSEGFNGPPRQLQDELIPWNVRPAKYAYIVHAEANAIDYCAYYRGGKALVGSKLYCTHVTCTDCMLKCIKWDIREIITPSCAEPYKLTEFHKVSPDELIHVMKFPKINLRTLTYERKPI